MVITGETITAFAGLLGAIGAIGAVIWAIIRWFQKQEKQSVDILDLRCKHEEDIHQISEELCILSYAILATLDGLKQQGCNGEVTRAHEKLEKHLNQKAHNR